MKKYYLVHEDAKILLGTTLYRIRYLRDCGWCYSGDLGGYVECEDNFSHIDESWIGENACVFGGARVEGNAKVYGRAWVYENSVIKGNASVFDYATVKRSSIVKDDSLVFGSYVVENETIHNRQKRVRYV